MPETGAGAVTKVITEATRAAAAATEGAAQATAPAAGVVAEGAAGITPIVTAPVVEGAGVVAETAGAMAPQASEASALLSSADLAASAEPVVDGGSMDILATGGDDTWGVPEPATGGEDAGTAEAVGPEPTDPATPTAEPIIPTDTEPAAAEQTDTAGLKPGDRSYDAIIAEGDAKRAFEAAKADPATSPEDLARLEKEYAGATRERQEAVTDRDSATIDARTEQIKREVTDSVRQEFQGQIDKLSLSNVELRQAIQDMGRQVVEAMRKNNTEAFSEFKKYVDEQDPKKKEALWVKILVILATAGKEFLKGSDIDGAIQQGTTTQRR